MLFSFCIPEHELEILTSRSGGPGGQHVNKTESRITARWNIHTSQALNDLQKKELLHKFASRLTNDGYLSISVAQSRSQYDNKKKAIFLLNQLVKEALKPRTTRKKTTIPRLVHEKRIVKKRHRGLIKKIRSSKNVE